MPEDKVFRLAEVKATKGSKETLIIIHNKVYNVSKFLEEHPGGEEVLLEQSGGDSTEAFEDVGHSSDARDLMKTYYVGDIHPDDKTKKTYATNTGPTAPPPAQSNSWTGWLLPIAIALAAAFAYRYIVSQSA